MSGYIDNSKYRQMIAKRPPLGLIPSARPKVLGQYLGANWYSFAVFASLLGIVAYKQITGIRSATMFDTRK